MIACVLSVDVALRRSAELWNWSSSDSDGVQRYVYLHLLRWQ